MKHKTKRFIGVELQSTPSVSTIAYNIQVQQSNTLPQNKYHLLIMRSHIKEKFWCKCLCKYHLALLQTQLLKTETYQ